MQKVMNKKNRDLCKKWIKKNISRSPRNKMGSYGLKHMLQKLEGIYATDEEFQEVMLECGFVQDEKFKSIFYVRVNPEVLMKYYK